MKFVVLSESLASAIAKYGDTLEVDWIADFDPSPTKKYLDFLCKNWDGIRDMYEGTQDEDNMYDFIQDTLKKFTKISKNLPKKDINQYVNWNEVLLAVEEYSTRKDKRNPIKKIHPESEIIFENENIVVIRVDSYEASEQYGSGKFCIASNEDNWDEYTANGEKFFYIFEKNNIHRPWVLQIYWPTEEGESVEFTSWNFLNQPGDGDELIKKYGLDEELFIKEYQKHPPETENDYFLRHGIP